MRDTHSPQQYFLRLLFQDLRHKRLTNTTIDHDGLGEGEGKKVKIYINVLAEKEKVAY